MSLKDIKITNDKIETHAKTIFKHLDPEATWEIEINDDGCFLKITSGTSGLLIGRHGETLEALQHILRLMVAQDAEEYIPLTLDIADYRALRAKEIEEMTQKAAEKVISFGGIEALPPMNAYERRLAHVVLANISAVEGISEGEGSERRLVIRPKK